MNCGTCGMEYKDDVPHPPAACAAFAGAELEKARTALDGALASISEKSSRLRRYQLMVKHIALLAEDPHPLKYERAGGDCVCGKCGLAYFDHPKGSEDFLTLLCDGSQVKL